MSEPSSPDEPSRLRMLRQQRRAEGSVRPDARTLLVQAAERELATTPLHSLSVERILTEAGVSRQSFYSYFDSKYELVGALLTRVMEDVHEVWRPFLERSEDDDASTSQLRGVCHEAVQLWCTHRAIFQVIQEYWNSVPEIGDQWLTVMERFTTEVAAVLDRDREAGLAPPGRDSRQLAATGLWASVQLLYLAGTGRSHDFPDETAILDVLVELWLRLLYGDAPRRR